VNADEIQKAIDTVQRRRDAAALMLGGNLRDGAPAALVDDQLEANDVRERAERDRLVSELGQHLPALARPEGAPCP